MAGLTIISAFFVLLVGFGVPVAQAQQEIRIGVLVPLTGPLAKSGEDSLRGHNLLWEQVGNKVAGRPVRIIVGDEACNPDAGITQARRLVHAEKVHFLVGPLCGHVGKAVAQVSRETGVPVLMAVAGPDEVTKWKRVPTVIRTGFSASQNAHPFGEYIAKEKGCKNTTFIGQDYTFGQENTLGVVDTYKLSGGKVAKILWTPIGTADYGPVLGGIPSGTDCVVVTVVGADRNRLFEQWFDFGYDRKFKVYGNYWLAEKRVPTVIRTGFSASQNAHPFGEYIAKEKGCKNTTFIGQDYTFGQENTLGVVDTYKLSGGKVAKILWTPIGTADYGPVLGGIPSGTDCVVVTVVGADRNRLFEQWFDFGYDRKFKVYGNYWLLNDVLPEVDDRAIGLISQALHYAAGLDTPENKAFVNAFAKRYKVVPSYFAENYYSTALWAKTALDAINGRVEDKAAFLKAVREAKFVAPRGPISLDEYDNPIQNTYISKVVKRKHPILGEVLMNVPVKTYKAVSQFWTWKPEEYLARGPYKR